MRRAHHRALSRRASRVIYNALKYRILNENIEKMGVGDR